MSAEPYFSVDKVTPLSQVPCGGHIFLLGICGSAMAPLAVQLSALGYQVSGVDREYYDPMGALLKGAKLSLHRGFEGEFLDASVDLVIIGNVIAASNPQLRAVEKLGLNYSLLPQLLYDLVLSKKHSIVISGTHGKSSTTLLTRSVFLNSGLSPSTFVAAQPIEAAHGFFDGTDPFGIIEGDEYDSAFFAKVPKFNFYKPDTLVVTSIEFDHADIYSDLDQIYQQFFALISNMSPGGVVIACQDNLGVCTQLKVWKDLGVKVFNLWIFRAI